MACSSCSKREKNYSTLHPPLRVILVPAGVTRMCIVDMQVQALIQSWSWSIIVTGIHSLLSEKNVVLFNKVLKESSDLWLSSKSHRNYVIRAEGLKKHVTTAQIRWRNEIFHLISNHHISILHIGRPYITPFFMRRLSYVVFVMKFFIRVLNFRWVVLALWATARSSIFYWKSFSFPLLLCNQNALCNIHRKHEETEPLEPFERWVWLSNKMSAWWLSRLEVRGKKTMLLSPMLRSQCIDFYNQSWTICNGH